MKRTCSLYTMKEGIKEKTINDGEVKQQMRQTENKNDEPTN